MKKEDCVKVYAGVLGKLIGVFFGRPVEGWPYEKIRRDLKDVDRYVFEEVGTPLHVADDDLAGTFTFFNTLEDAKDPEAIAPEDYGETWLNYVIPEKTTFWWGGLGRSTEHTAYLRLQSGVKAPLSGSVQTNGQSVAEQIGAQIFMDAFALACPNDPERARELVANAARVSHDGVAVESACFLASMEALAFSEPDVNRLIDKAIDPDMSERLRKVIEDVRRECRREKDWRKVRDWLEEHYGYHHYCGNCHVIPNLALLLAALILGGDSFWESMKIVVSCGWDTDCNAANLGVINGVRLGLDAITAEYDFRGPVGDRFYNISSDGGACVTDAVLQTRRILREHARLYQKPMPERLPRFAFEMPGSVQGFQPDCVNGNTLGLSDGLLLPDGECATLTLWNPADRHGGYCLLGSPTLYEGQRVRANFESLAGEPQARLFVRYFDFDDHLRSLHAPWQPAQGKVEWLIPSLGGCPIAAVGVEKKNGQALLRDLDWDGAPERLDISGSLRNYEQDHPNMTLLAFTASAKQFSFDARRTFTVSHPEMGGLATLGTEQWRDYSVSTTFLPCLYQRFGLVVRAKGHRRYYAAVFSQEGEALLLRREGSREAVLARCAFAAAVDEEWPVTFTVQGNRLSLAVRDEPLLTACDDMYSCGAAGFLVDEGTVMADGFHIRSQATDSSGPCAETGAGEREG